MLNRKGILPELVAIFEEMKMIRQDIHAHPELGYKEYRTSNIIATCLTQWGYTVTQGVANTGVVGILKVGNGTKSIGIRAEMDALPIEEKTGLDYASNHQGKMHACGHDGHVVTLLAAAKYLALTKRFSGTINLIFQPSEEKDAGAMAMIEDGLFDIAPCDLLYCMHNYPHPDLALGQMCLHHGEIMASADSLIIKIIGQGCHAASPHFGHDPIIACAAIIQALQSIVSRNTDPLKSTVLSITSIQAGNSFNIIPEEVELKLTIRTLDEEQRSLIKRRIKEIVEYQGKSFNVQTELSYQGLGYPVLINDIKATDIAKKTASRHFDENHLKTKYEPILASDDFAFMSQKIPSCYINVGNGNSVPLHNPQYNFNDDLIPIMASFWGHLVEDNLN